MSVYIGFDIGGTKIAAIALDDAGKQLSQERIATPHGYDAIISAMQDIVRSFNYEQYTIGVGVPGFVTPGDKKIFAPNLPWLMGKPFQSDVEAMFGQPIRLANDGVCMTLSEAIDGAGANFSNVFCAILGTGVGGGHAYQKRCLVGANGFTEWGHLSFPWRREDEPATLCGCGRMGCIETMCHGAALSALYQKHVGHAAKGEEISAQAKAGNPAALAVLDEFYDRVARAFMVPIQTLDPDVIVIGGSLCLLPNIVAAVQEKCRLLAFHQRLNTQIRIAKHGADTGQRGAAWLWRKHD